MIPADNNLPLAGLSVVITRPIKQSDLIHKQLTELGAKPILFPCLDIVCVDCQPALQALPVNIADVDIFIFVSANAVAFGMAQISALDKNIKATKMFAAIGQATAQGLRQAGVNKILAPEQSFDSEQLLQLPELTSLAGCKVLIIKGVGGRTSLYDTLLERQADVYTLDVYQRKLPTKTDPSLLQQPIDAVLFTSSEIVENILTLTPANSRATLLQSQAITGHQRIAAKVASLGFEKLPIIAVNPSDAEMLVALQKWANKMENHNEH